MSLWIATEIVFFPFAMDLELEVVLKIDLAVQDLRVLKERRCFFERRSKQKCGHIDRASRFSEYEAEPLLVVFCTKDQFWDMAHGAASNYPIKSLRWGV